MTSTKAKLLARMRPPGFEMLSDSAKTALIDELCKLPEEFEAPACARVNEVIDALRRTSERAEISVNDRALFTIWQAIQHAAKIATFLDLVTLGARAVDANPPTKPS